MLNNGAKWYNFSPPKWSFIAPPLTRGRHAQLRTRRTLPMAASMASSTIFDDNSGKPKRIVVQVKSGSAQRNQIATLKCDFEREKADLALFISLKEPIRPMNDEAIGAVVLRPRSIPRSELAEGADPHHRGAACRRTSRIPSLRARSDIPASTSASERSPPGTACIAFGHYGPRTGSIV